MTLTKFRVVAVALIVFCFAGDVATWTAHLWAPGRTWTHAILQGTEFTSPVAFTAFWVIFVLMTWMRGVAAKAGVALMSLSGLIFAAGETGEFFTSNVGVSDAKWNFILVATGAGLALGLATCALGIGYLWQDRGKAKSPPRVTNPA